jgi:PAS domain S-box-containing protein
MIADRADWRWPRRITGASGVLVAGLGVFALLGWMLRVPAWPSLWSDTTPMAPSTALLFLVLGTAVCVRAWLPRADTSLRWAVPIGVLVTLIGLVLAVTSSMGIFLKVEQLGIPILITPGQYPLGHMSPLTAILFVAGGLSFLASLRWPVARRRLPQASWWLACLLMAVGLILTLGYLIGVDQLHGIPAFPPAALTSASFFLLGIGLLCLADLRARQVDPRSVGRELSFGLLLLIFGLLAVGIITIGTLSYRTYEDNYRNEVDRQLLAVWQLKVIELEDWRRGWIGDAQVLYGNSTLSGLVERFLEEPQDQESRRQLTEWLGRYPAAYECDRVFLIDARGVERLSVPETGVALAPHMIQEAAAALGSREIAFLDFQRAKPSGQVYLALLIPVIDGQEGSRPIGTLILRIDPQVYLYPFIARWPTPSETAETLLVRREGEEVVILNELRFRRGSALNLRFPLTQLDLPLAAAARGETGFMEGIDYRGVQVTAYVGPVSDSPWSLVARMDTAEIYAPLQGRLWQTIAFFGLLMAASGAGLGVFWRQERLRYYQSRAETAEALRASEEKFRKAFLITPDAVAISRLFDGRFVSVNAGFTNTLGYAETEVAGRSSGELGLWVAPEARKEFVARLLALGTVHNFEAVFRTKTGEHRQGLVSAAIIELDGEPHILNTTRDISERKRAERELQVLSSRNVAILAAVPDIIAEVDENKVYTWVNRAGVEFFGDGVIGKEAAFYFEGEQDTYALVQPLFDGMEETFYIESWQRRQDGENRLLGWWCRALKDAQGNVIGALSTGRDVTERDRAEARLRESEVRYRTLVEYSPIAIFVSRSDRVVLANEVCFQLFGAAEPGELIGKSPFELFHPDFQASIRESFHELRDHGGAVPLKEGKIVRVDGTAVDVEVTAASFQDQGGASIHVVLSDITERKRWEDDLRTLNAELELGVAARTAQLEDANKELEAFAYSVSHDLRAPLRAMHGFSAALLSESRDRLDEQGRHYVDRIGAAAKHMGELVDALLDLSRIARREMGHQPVDLSALAREVAAELQTQDPQRRVEWVIADELIAQGDANLLSVALQNLLGNAWKFTGPRLQPRIEVGTLPRTSPASAPASGGEEGGTIYFVRDNGVGFDMAYADKLFSPFQRLHGMREFPGTGIGLATVQRIIARHGGRLWAEAEVDQGATFYFTLESA